MGSNKNVQQHKQMAMGGNITGTKVVGMKSGGMVKGVQVNPITAAKMGNGVPGFAKGGKKK